MATSRLARRSIKQSRKQLYISLAGIVVVLFLAINFGPVIIGTMGGLIDALSGKSSEKASISSNTDFQPPTLDPLPDATPSARINITGRAAYQDGQIDLFVNNSKFESKEISGQDFEFSNVPLNSGENSIKARYVKNNKKSDFSDEENISYIKDAPKLDITSPGDHSTFTKGDQEITVSGKTDPENSVTVNNLVAIVDSSGNFSYTIKLSEGDNKITVTTTNPAGNSTSKDITVIYSP